MKSKAYIEVQALIADMRNASHTLTGGYLAGFADALQRIKAAPIVHVEEVVYCNDCAFCYRGVDPEHGRTTHYCEKLYEYVDRYFYCRYGKNKKV